MNNKGYFDKVLAIDVETSGLFYGKAPPNFDHTNGDYYQIVSIGLVVADAKTLNPVDEFYVEIKWDGKSLWDKRAEKTHKLSKEHLEEHGVSDLEALDMIVKFLLKHWSNQAEWIKDQLIILVGQNCATFDIWYLRYLFAKYDVPMPKISNRIIDTSAIGWVVFNVFNSDDLFEALEIDRGKMGHNALADAKMSLKAVQIARLMNAG